MQSTEVLTAGDWLHVLSVTGGGCGGGGDRQLCELLLRFDHLGVGLSELQSQCLR